MEIGQRVATWLDLAAAPWRDDQPKVKVHAVGGRKDGCFALSVDGRWLCTADGQLTVFFGVEAALRFLKTARTPAFEPGDAPAAPVRCDGRHYGLGIARSGCLMSCADCGRVPEFNG